MTEQSRFARDGGALEEQPAGWATAAQQQAHPPAHMMYAHHPCQDVEVAVVSLLFQEGQRVRLPGDKDYLTIDGVFQTPQGWRLFLAAADGEIRKITLTAEQARQVEVLTEDGLAPSSQVLGCLWAEWMKAASLRTGATALATTPLRPYAHQNNAVYRRGIPAPAGAGLGLDQERGH